MSDVKGKTGAVLRETAVLTGAVAIIAAGGFFAFQAKNGHNTIIFHLIRR